MAYFNYFLVVTKFTKNYTFFQQDSKRLGQSQSLQGIANIFSLPGPVDWSTKQSNNFQSFWRCLRPSPRPARMHLNMYIEYF